MPGTITLANIAIGYDAKQLKAGIDLSRKDISQLQKNLEATLTPMQRFQTEIQALQKAVEKGALGTDKAGYERTIRAVNTIAEKYKGMLTTEQARARAYEILGIKVGAVTKELEKQLDLEKKLRVSGGGGGVLGIGIGSFTVGGMAASAGWKIFNLLTDAVNSLTIGSVKLAAEIETTSIAFEVLTNSGTEALSLLSKMRKLDKESPLDFMSIQRAGKTLLGYGLSAKAVMPSLQALSKISMGNAQRFELLSLAFAQVASRGKLAGDEVRQMVNQGFNPLMAIAEKMARESGGTAVKYMDMLRRAMEEGVISFELVQLAMEETTTGSGKFAKMNERMVDSVSGQWNKLLSNWQSIQLAMGQAISPVVMLFLETANSIIGGEASKFEQFMNLTDIAKLFASGPSGFISTLYEREKRQAEERARKQKEDEKRTGKTAQQMIDEKREFERKEAEKKKLAEEQQRVKDKLQNEVDKLDEKVAGEARRLGMSPRQAALDERFFDLMKEVNSVFGANSVEVKKLNGLMQQSGKQFDKELKIKEQEIQSEAKKKQAERQDRFNKWFMESVNPDNLTSAKTELLQKDSVEAYKFLIKRDDAIEKRKEQIAEEQKKLQEDNNEILKRMQEDLKDAPRLVKI